VQAPKRLEVQRCTEYDRDGGAAPKAIQELVGHSTLSMTHRYMHLAPSALCEAIGLLNFGQPVGSAASVAV